MSQPTNYRAPHRTLRARSLNWLGMATIRTLPRVGSEMITGNIAVVMVAAVVVDLIGATDIGPTVALDEDLPLL